VILSKASELLWKFCQEKVFVANFKFWFMPVSSSCNPPYITSFKDFAAYYAVVSIFALAFIACW